MVTNEYIYEIYFNQTQILYNVAFRGNVIINPLQLRIFWLGKGVDIHSTKIVNSSPPHTHIYIYIYIMLIQLYTYGSFWESILNVCYQMF